MRLLFATVVLLFHTLVSAQKPINPEDIWKNDAYKSKVVQGFNFRNDGVHYTLLEDNAIVQYDLRSGEKSGVMLEAASLQSSAAEWKGKIDDYAFSADEKKILLAVGKKPIYRWSTRADYFVYNSANKALTPLMEGSKQRYPAFSPDASKVAFVADNDLYIRDLTTDALTRVTTDGKINNIINGASDWVYEEEFELLRAFEWSPDGKNLAYLRFDESLVPEVTMDMYTGEEYPEEVTFKYPKVGEKNAVVTAHLYNIASSKTLEVQLPDRQAEKDDYLPRLDWTPTG